MLTMQSSGQEGQSTGTKAAQIFAQAWISEGLEVKVTDPYDNIVFHSKDGKTLVGENFWRWPK